MPNSHAVEQRAQVPSGDERAGADTAAAPEAELRDSRAELEAMEDRYKRALADLDNYRKRSARETERRIAEAEDRVLRDWLEAVDSVERALRLASDPALAAGLRAVLEQIEAILGRERVERIGATGERFDPQRHDAVGVRVAGDVPDGTIVDVVRSGFSRSGRVLRPAEVIVADAREHDR
jgi:molecular chaperone GrpE